jgi:hypothetical protein
MRSGTRAQTSGLVALAALVLVLIGAQLQPTGAPYTDELPVPVQLRLAALPARTAGVVLWLDGADAKTLTADTGGTTPAAAGQTVTRWSDKSPSANHAVQAVASARPVVAVDGSRTVAGFDGADSLVLDPALLPAGSAASTVFVVARLADGHTGDGVAFAVGSTGSARTAGTTGFRSRVGSGTVTSAWPSGSPALLVTTHDPTTGITVWADGGNPASAPGPFSTGSTFAGVGAFGGSGHWTGAIHEIVVFDRVLGDVERREMETYLAARWSIPLAPVAPGAPSAAATGDGAVTLTWSVPASGTAPAATDHLVQYRPQGGGTWTLFPDGVSSATSATVTGLSAGTVYELRVAAANGAGVSGFSPPASVQAQAAWTPADLPGGVSVWLDASQPDAFELAGSAVARWRDRSGNRRDVVQAAAANRPARTTDGPAGRTVVTSTAAGQVLVGNERFATDGLTVVALFRKNGNGANTNDDNRFVEVSGSNDAAQPDRVGWAEGAMLGVGHATPSTGWLVGTATRPTTRAAGSYLSIFGTLGHNGTSPYLATGVSTGDALDGIGDVAEVVVADRVLTADERARVEGYLAHRWGTSGALDAAHPYRTTPPLTASPAAPPAAPGALTATPASSAVALAWSPPAGSATPVRDHVIEHRPVGGGSWTTLADGVGTATSAVVTGLTNGTAHEFRVASVSAAGTGAWATTTATPAETAAPAILVPPGASANLVFCRYAADCAGLAGAPGDGSYQFAFTASAGSTYGISAHTIDAASTSWATGTALAGFTVSSPTAGTAIAGTAVSTTNAGTTVVTVTGVPADRTVVFGVTRLAGGLAASATGTTDALGVYTTPGNHTLRPPASGAVSVLVIGGGGGGSSFYGGGGGAGGRRSDTVTLAGGSPVGVTVGAGGAGGTYSGGSAGGPGSEGQPSGFGTLTASGGGRSTEGGSGSAGGSGGGGRGYYGYAGGAGNLGGFTPPEGHPGGAGQGGTVKASGGGGGAGGPGGTATGGRAGAGGPGLPSLLSGTAVVAAGGGGGGAGSEYGAIAAGPGGIGGGGAGAIAAYPTQVAGTAGLAGRGAGGGSGSQTGAGGTGGSGIVVVRRTTASTPSAPGGLTATAGSDDVRLDWSAPADGGAPIGDYVVEYRTASTGTWVTFTDGIGTVTTATVTGLSTGTAYDFRVRALNAAGEGPSAATTATPSFPAPSLVVPPGAGANLVFCRYAVDCAGLTGAPGPFSYQLAFTAVAGATYEVTGVSIDATSTSWTTGSALTGLTVSTPTAGASVVGGRISTTNPGTTVVTVTGLPTDRVVVLGVRRSNGGVPASPVAYTDALGVYTTPGTHTLQAPAPAAVAHLVVAGGGGGAWFDQNNGAGGGGAGGLLASDATLTTLGAGTSTITVGGGGAGATGGYSQGSDGQASSVAGPGLAGLAAVGGGGGGNGPNTQFGGSGRPGGSGGGGGGYLSGAGGTGTTGQGNAGGTGSPSNGAFGTRNAAGGGGAGAAGGAGSVSTAGAGGSGRFSAVTGIPVAYAGGGGGGNRNGGPVAGGVGGGGAGGTTTTGGTSATASTGGGGGGAGGSNGAPGAGASGIVVLRRSTATPAAAPGTPSITGGDGQLTLAWTPPASDGGAPVVDYVVEHRTSPSGPWTLVPDGVSVATTATVTGLTNGTVYDVRVAAVTAMGTGSWSAPATGASGLPWTPASLTGLGLWLDAADAATFTLSDGASVAQWRDKSPAARHAGQTTAASRPMLTAGLVGGLPSVVFDGGDDFLAYDGSFLANTDYTIAAVVARSSVRATNYYLAGSAFGLNANLHAGWASDWVTHRQYSNDYGALLAAFTVPVDQLHLYEHSGTTGKRIWIQGTTVASS